MTQENTVKAAVAAQGHSAERQSQPLDLLAINRIAFQTIVRKEIRRFARIWVQTIVPPSINAVLYMLIFGSLIGSRISDMDGFRYIDFIVPGIIMMAVIINSYSNVVSSFFSSKMQNYIEELLVSPVSNLTIVIGYVCGGMARGLLVGSLVALVSLFFSEIRPVHPFVTISVAVLTSMMFSLGGLINAVFAKSFDDISIVPNFILTPLTYLGGVFYSISMLPPFWQTLSMFNPMLYMINGFRFGILGASDIPIWTSFIVILVFIALLGTIAMMLLNRGTGIKH
ncbi:ABC transporter permease [Granulosicoccus sp. 3-233]|uniref:ABC transporter permease n=1 Tax=Granulosicoccus sp. 3-233 TaxID=3417969 RepID=UPI003D354659